MAKVELTRRAHADLVRLREFLDEVSPAAADRAAEAILHGVRRLKDLPQRGPRSAGTSLRELRIHFGRYGYVVRYGVVGERVIISRIFHGREQR
jgi:plasmid stabilization system protein ParE